LSENGATRVVEALERLGVELVFGLPGVHNLPIWDVLRESSIRLVGVRHEQTAVYAADGHARATGRLGVALVTTGPGAANTLGATGEAMAASTPVLVIATDIPAALRRPGVYRGVLHETRDQPAMFAPVTRAAHTVDDPDRLGDAVVGAGALAQAAPSGPVYVGVPTDYLRAEAAPLSEPARAGGRVPEPPPSAEDEARLRLAVDLLAGAERPLIWAGGGALRSDAGDAIGELATKLAAPVVTTYMGRGLIPPSHPCAVQGPVHAPEVGVLWDEADVVLAVGSDLDGMMTQNWAMPAPAHLIAVNVDEADANKSYPAEVTLVGDARPIVERLADQVPSRDGVDALQQRLGDIGGAVIESAIADDPEAVRFLAALEHALPQDAVVVADMCIPGYWLGYRRVPAPRKLAYPMGWGTLGFGFPASIGSALANAGPAVAVCGDGGFLFACGELATVKQEDVPVTVVIVDDGGYGMLRFDQENAGREPFGVDLARPDFVQLATSFGIDATKVDGFGEPFEQALRSGVQSSRPNVIVVTAALTPPPTTSPRWYRRKQQKEQRR